jgi:tetratricopeptide (TPR) repeat protein
MRATGVEPVRASVEKRPERRRPVLITLGVGALLIAAVAVFLTTRKNDLAEGPAPLRPLDASEMATFLKREQVEAEGLSRLLVPDATVIAFAKQAASGKGAPLDKATAITAAVRARAKALAFAPWSLGEPRPTPVMLPKETLSALEKDGARRELYPLEVTALEVAALRALGVNAMVAELVAVPGERAPLDPSGYLGYFVVAVFEGEAAKEKAPKLFDPYGGRTLDHKVEFAVLDDPSAVGAALALRAVHEVAYLADPRKALDTSSKSLTLASRLPSVRTARGIIVLSSKLLEQGLQELSAASQMRPDPVRLHNLASARMLSGDIESAQRDVTSALGKMPDYAGAHGTLGALHLMRGDIEAGRAELRKAEGLAPDLSLIQWGFAELTLREGDRDGALARAKRAYDKRPSFDSRLRYAVLLRQASRYEQMRKLAHELVDGAPDYRKSELKELLVSVLGPTALDAIEPDPSADDLSDLGGPDLRLDLGGDTLADPSAPRGLTLGAGADADPLILSGDESKLRLRGPDQNLKLDLSK